MNRDEVKHEIEYILSKNGFLETEAEDFFSAMDDILCFMADEMENSQPYATSTIGAYREVSMNLGDYDDVIESLVSEKDEDED